MINNNLNLNNELSDKYRLNDVLRTDKKRRTIKQLIESSPLQLWQKIHSKHSNVSLVRNVYAMLKAEVAKKRPDLVERAEKQHLQHKTKKILRKALKDGTVGLPNGRFKKIASRKIID
jgi:hypothetical protein